MSVRRFDKFREVIENFLNNVTLEAARNLASEGKGGGRLEQAVMDAGRYKINPNSVEIEFDFGSADYALYVDQGVAAAGEGVRFGGGDIDPMESSKPFGFKDYLKPGKGMALNIHDWLQEKQGGGKLKDAYRIARSVRQHGVERTLFFTKPYRKYYKRLPDEFIDAFGFEIQDLFNFL